MNAREKNALLFLINFAGTRLSGFFSSCNLQEEKNVKDLTSQFAA